MQIKCLVIDEMHPSLVPMLEDLGIIVDYQPNINTEALNEIIGKYEGLVVRSKVYIDQNFLRKATRLRFIARAGAGLDNIASKAVDERKITVLNAPEGNRDAVAEHVLGLILGLLNHLVRSHQQIGQLQWLREENRGHELGSRVVGLLGYGNMGKAVAQRLKCFGCKVIAHDKYLKDFSDENAEEVTLQTLWQETDILSIHIPLEEGNEHFINYDFIQNFQKSIYIINTSRGGILSLGDLCNAMKEKKVLGAGLDVLENEKLHTLSTKEREKIDFLAGHQDVILTPHIAGWSYESYHRINTVLVEKIKHYINLNF